MKKLIILIGAGNLGSRHLQALKNVKIPLKIIVIEPNPKVVLMAKERYNSIPPSDYQHEIIFKHNIENFNDVIDLAIIATNSDVRKMVIEELLNLNKVKYMILEKILFQKINDYLFIEKLLRKSNCQAWVNCTRRLMPVYNEQIKDLFYKKKIIYCAYGSNWGMISNIIHYLDMMIYFLENYDFVIDLSNLDHNPIPSKRKDFIELTGVLQIHFKGGSHGIFTCFPSGNLPLMSEITSDTIKCVLHEFGGIAWLLKEKSWQSFKIEYLHVSQLTTIIVEEIFNENKSSLTPYIDSMKMHLAILNPVMEFLNKYSDQKYTIFPFT